MIVSRCWELNCSSRGSVVVEGLLREKRAEIFGGAEVKPLELKRCEVGVW